MDPTPVFPFRPAVAAGAALQPLQGEAPLAQHASARRACEPAMHWPEELLEAFSLRMARHGMSVSPSLMRSDKTYAVQQLLHGQGMADEGLQLMSAQLFRHFQARQSGIAPLH